MRDFAISAMANSTTQDVRHRAQKPITGPERRKERETFCVRYGKWTRFLRWRTQLHKTTRNASRFSIYIALLDVIESRVMKRTSIRYCAVRSFEPAMGKSTKLLQFYLSQIFYHYNVYIIMIFFVFILKHHDTNVYKSFSFF